MKLFCFLIILSINLLDISNAYNSPDWKIIVMNNSNESVRLHHINDNNWDVKWNNSKEIKDNGAEIPARSEKIFYTSNKNNIACDYNCKTGWT